MRTDIFTYDEMGNRKGIENHVASRGWTEFKRRNNGLNQYGEWYSIIHHDDHFAEDPKKANGVVMMEGGIGASFNALNQPIAMYSASTLPRFVWFGYDPLGRCVKRWLGDDQGNAPENEGGYAPGNPNPVTTYLYYDGWNLVQEGTAPDSPTLLYVHGGRVDEVVAQIKPQSNQLRYLQYDARGHCTFQTDTTGSIMEQYEYDAFGLPYFYDGAGNPTTLANGLPGSLWGNRILFTGREYLSDMRIYDFRNRVYHPEMGRFLQPDPKHFAAGDYNLYRYCHNDPVNKNDPLGLDAQFIVYREGGRGSLNNEVTVYENGKYVGSFRANENPFKDGTRGPREGTYALLPRQDADANSRFPNGTPAITAPQYANPDDPSYAPGRAGPDYKPTVFVHPRARENGVPDSEACLTCSPDAASKVKQVMDRNMNKGGTTVRFIDKKPEATRPELHKRKEFR